SISTTGLDRVEPPLGAPEIGRRVDAEAESVRIAESPQLVLDEDPWSERRERGAQRRLGLERHTQRARVCGQQASRERLALTVDLEQRRSIDLRERLQERAVDERH